MRWLSIKRRSGFTFIELLVVISIISLLSAVILASVKDAQNNAKAKAFRAEVNQFINALEMYRNDNGDYPGPIGSMNYVYNYSDGTYLESLNLIGFESTIMYPYIKKIPHPYITGTTLGYRRNKISSSPLFKRCADDSTERPYILTISNTQPGFEDWPYVVTNSNTNPVTVNATIKCFSLK